MKLLLLIAIVIVVSCSNKDTGAKKVEIIKSKESISRTISKDRILGLWTDGETENATIEIKQDSIYYIDLFESYPYTLSGDTIIIVYPDMDIVGKINIEKNTLTIDSEEGITKFWRFLN